MSAPMTPDREQEIRTREQAATPGPWMSDGAEIYGTLGGVLMIDLWVGETLDVENQERSNADAAFIATARSAVPELLAEVDRLRTELADQARATEYFANQSRRRGNQLAADPTRRQVTPVEELAYDMDTALVNLPPAERRGADAVLQVLRARAAAAVIPFTTEATS
ncbi:hypothetical protein [Streptomyces sp. NPDC060322]|uniref:hypothetical protein n=1 Tax=Streptomyces sp. NPDC060322 TaxID=3347097 RepID=UPI003649E12B